MSINFFEALLRLVNTMPVFVPPFVVAHVPVFVFCVCDAFVHRERDPP